MNERFVPEPAPRIRRWMTSCHSTLRAAGQVVLLIALCPAFLTAQALEPREIQRQQQDQQRAKVMTRELLHGVLDLQLRQLEENQLTELEVYRDIQLMRDHLSDVVEAEMTTVIELLTMAQSQPVETRQATFTQARQLVRTIVLNLSASRQNLLRRLKIAELAEQVRRLIALQSKVANSTKQIALEPQVRQEAMALKAIEDQRDIKELFLLLGETLDDVRTWGGPLSQTAADGSKLLKAANVGQDLDQAGNALRTTQFAEAVVHQETAIRRLSELLKLVERAQGVTGAANQSALDQLREIASRQQALQDETRQQDSAASIAESLVERQQKIPQELTKLLEAVRQQPQAEAHLDQAQSAALAATEKLFENQPEQAVAEQTKVLGQLAALESVLQAASADSTADQSAEELGKLVDHLEQVRRDLIAADEKQREATKLAATNARAAAEPEAQIAAALDLMVKHEGLPASVKTPLEEAKLAAERLAENLAVAKSEPMQNSERDQLEHVKETINRAVSSIESALEQARRRQAAVKIGELARAAEVLERVAAEEREIAAVAESVSKLADDEPAETAKLTQQAAERQERAAAVAERLARGLESTAPSSAQQVTAGLSAASQSRTELLTAAAALESSSDNAEQATESAANLANSAADNFAAAAQSLRMEIARSAAQLSDASSTRAEQLQSALQQVEATLREHSPSPLTRLEQLVQAQTKVTQAEQHQQLAAGKPAAAQAMELREQIAAAAQSQQEAGELAVAAQNDENISPLRAAVEQQAAVERMLAAAKSASARAQAAELKQTGHADPIVQALNNAQTQAQAAAKNLVDGELGTAQANQTAADAALKSALASAHAEFREAARKPAERMPNPEAQDEVLKSAQEARELAMQDAPEAAQSLAEAVDAGNAAQAELANRQSSGVRAAQERSMQSLQDAAQSIQSAMKRLTEEQGRQLEQLSQVVEQLQDNDAGLDLGAAEALGATKNAAEEGANPRASPSERRIASQRAQQNLERAAANLATTQQSLRRDQAVATALSELATEQMEAAKQLSEPPDQLAESAAAEVMSKAAETFSEAQQALGQGAVELSGQREVANQPLREALKMASEFLSLKELGEDLHRLPMDAAHGQMPDEKVPTDDPNQSSVDRPETEDRTSDDTPPDMPSGADASQGIQPPLDLGTQFVPKSPEITAKMMAGPQARAAMKAADEERAQAARQRRLPANNSTRHSALAKKLTRAERSNLQTDSSEPADSADTGDTSEFSANQQNFPSDNPSVKDGPVQKMDEGTNVGPQRGKIPTGDSHSPGWKDVRDAPWFARLPPELRRSIRSSAQQRAPRAYEERLRKYFESVD